jgi:hypothetical protein
MRRLGLCAAFLTGVVAVLAAAGCGGSDPAPTSNTTPNTKQMEKEGGRAGGPKMK